MSFVPTSHSAIWKGLLLFEILGVDTSFHPYVLRLFMMKVIQSHQNHLTYMGSLHTALYVSIMKAYVT